MLFKLQTFLLLSICSAVTNILGNDLTTRLSINHNDSPFLC